MVVTTREDFFYIFIHCSYMAWLTSQMPVTDLQFLMAFPNVLSH